MMLLFFCGSYQSHASTWHNSLLPPAPSRRLDSLSLHYFSDFLIPILGGHPQIRQITCAQSCDERVVGAWLPRLADKPNTIEQPHM
ncbi:hypothetical protein BDV33DRAFT_59114 [Aspergillus novoparasiticus]|uniref:Uncharacterized protein n=1 Tax=Aspergillus novoparasiticus TaxID=986946 RepID=A0A5N6F1H4_9EURO|nr:hypothetical protein BDV33DRAFT_59114 [Aspergillus novoparasiticus]